MSRSRSLRLSRPRRAMSLLELVAAFVVLGIIGGIAVAGWSQVTSGGADQAGSVRLGVVQAAARDLVVLEGSYPSDIVERIRPAGTLVVDGSTPSASADTVSLARLDDSNLVLAVQGGDSSCVLLFDGLDSRRVWAIDRDLLGECTASRAVSLHPSQDPATPVVSREANDPTAVSLP